MCKRHVTRTGIDSVKEVFKAKLGDALEAHDGEHEHMNYTFVWVFGFMQVLFIVLIAVFGKYDIDFEKVGYNASADTGGHRRLMGGGSGSEVVAAPTQKYNLAYTYPWYMDVHVMIFIGFGFLMTFLRKHSFGAVGLTFLLGAYCTQWHAVIEGLIVLILDGEYIIPMNVKNLIFHDFAAGAVLITYGVLLGKVNPLQMMLIATLEIIFYTINEVISLRMAITDLGGSMVIHMFGAYFGLTLATVMQQHWTGKNLKDNASVYHSDMFAMIGTVFLWMYWPSFNGVLGVTDEARHLAVINTVLSLCGSCVAAFLMSHWLRGERVFCMVDIQNATLAGGVVMGTAADMYSNPGISILIGAFAGSISVIGYVKIQPWLEKQTGLHDTCGVNNLHGMPSLIGAFFGMCVLSRNVDGARDTFPNQKQFGFIVITLGIAVIGGLITGFLVRLVTPVPEKNLFLDRESWEVPHEEYPYYFDKNGEVQRGEDDTDKGVARDVAEIKSRLDTFESLMAAKEKALPQVHAKPAPAAASPAANVEFNALEAMFTRIMDSRDNKKNA